MVLAMEGGEGAVLYVRDCGTNWVCRGIVGDSFAYGGVRDDDEMGLWRVRRIVYRKFAGRDFMYLRREVGR